MKVCTFKKKKIIWKCGQFLNVNNHLKGYEGLERERKQEEKKRMVWGRGAVSYSLLYYS